MGRAQDFERWRQLRQSADRAAAAEMLALIETPEVRGPRLFICAGCGLEYSTYQEHDFGACVRWHASQRESNEARL